MENNWNWGFVSEPLRGAALINIVTVTPLLFDEFFFATLSSLLIALFQLSRHCRAKIRLAHSTKVFFCVVAGIIITKALVRGWRQSHCSSGTVMINDRTGSQSEEGIKLLTVSKPAAPSLRDPQPPVADQRRQRLKWTVIHCYTRRTRTS